MARYLALTFGLEHDPAADVERVVGFIERVGRNRGIRHPIQMTVATSNGDGTWIVLGACTGAGTMTAALRAVQDKGKSSVPALGYTIPYALGDIILTAWGPVLLGIMSVKQPRWKSGI